MPEPSRSEATALSIRVPLLTILKCADDLITVFSRACFQVFIARSVLWVYLDSLSEGDDVQLVRPRLVTD